MNVLDMGESEIEGFVNVEEDGSFWATFYDPMPGGSGFLPQILINWRLIIDSAIVSSFGDKRGIVATLKQYVRETRKFGIGWMCPLAPICDYAITNNRN